MMRYNALNFRSLAMIIFAVLVISAPAAGQRRSRPKPKTAPARAAAPVPTKRPVTVTLKQGDQVEGNFLRADTETIEVEIQSGRLTIKMNDVASLVFVDEGVMPIEEEQKGAPRQPRTRARLPDARHTRRCASWPKPRTSNCLWGSTGTC
jgi:hypothetical protein